MTEPSAGLVFSASITTRPPAPARFSTMVVDAYVFICSATSLAMTSVGPPAGKPTMMRAVECNGCDRTGETPNAYDAIPPALPSKKRRRLGLVTRRMSVIATPCDEFPPPHARPQGWTEHDVLPHMIAPSVLCRQRCCYII